MKKLILAGMLALGLAAASHGEGWRIAVVDLSRVFDEHPKTAAAMEELKVQEEAVQEEMRQLVEEIDKKRTELAQAREAMNTPLLFSCEASVLTAKRLRVAPFNPPR